MSIWTKLEDDARKDIELLNKAMSLLYVISADPKTESYMKTRIADLEHEVKCHRSYDDRFKRTAVAFDLNRLHEEDDR
jgi:hypothetical protein